MHLELLTDVVAHMDRPNEHISSHMGKLHKLMEPALEEKDWSTCILVQNFIVEGLAVTLCEQQGEYGDDVIHTVFSKMRYAMWRLEYRSLKKSLRQTQMA